MKTYAIGYTEETFGTIWFQAESIGEAEQIIEKVRNGEISIDEVAGYDKKERYYEVQLVGNVDVTEC